MNINFTVLFSLHVSVDYLKTLQTSVKEVINVTHFAAQLLWNQIISKLITAISI